MNYPLSQPAVDEKQIIIAGKSLGSVVAYSVFQSTPEANSDGKLDEVKTQRNIDSVVGGVLNWMN